MKKHILAVSFTAILLLLSAGPVFCITAIEMWTTQTQSDRVKTLRLILDTFEALNPDIRVTLVPVDENQMPSQMAAASAAGNMPQVFEGNAALMLAFGQANIIDKQRATAIIKTIGVERFYHGALKMVKEPDTTFYYAVPFHGWIQGIWYRNDWFEKAGLPPPDTWEAILTAAKTFHKPGQNQYGILIGTQADTYAEQCFTHLALSNKAAQFDARGRLVFNSQPIKETVAFYKQLAQYTPPGPQTWRARDYYLQGKLAMFFYSTYIMDDLVLADADLKKLSAEDAADAMDVNAGLVEKTRVVTTISHHQPAGFGSVVCLGLSRTDDRQKATAADKLMTYMFEPLGYITFLHISPGGMNPLIRDVAGDPLYLNDPMGIFKRYGPENIQRIVTGFDHVGSFAVVDGKTFPSSGKIYAKQIIPRMLYSALFEGKSVDDAVVWAAEEMKKVISDAK